MGTSLERWAAALRIRKLELLALLEEHSSRRARGSAEAGQSTVEYAIIAAVIVVAAIAAMNAFGGGVTQVFARLVARLQGLG